MSARFDTVVIGGGPAGCAAAIRLARAGCRVAILEKSRPGAFCAGETLPPQASGLLAELGLLERFRTQNHRPAPGIVSAWGGTEPVVTDFLFSPHGSGWHIDRGAFNQLLKTAAVEAGAEYRSETSALACTRADSGWRLTTDAGATFTSRVLIDAAGRGARGVLGFPKRMVRDHLVSIVAIDDGESAEVSDYTLIESTEAGWFYSALLPNGRYIVTFTTDADLYSPVRALAFLDEQLSMAALTRARVRRFPQTPRVFSAASIFRSRTALPGWIAAGDAANSFDPLSGLGLVHSLTSGSAAASAALDQLDGRLESSHEYDATNRMASATYWRSRAEYYSLERRWPGSPFWERRQPSSRQATI
jgi:flavin-dependent dehydrogenase